MLERSPSRRAARSRRYRQRVRDGVMIVDVPVDAGTLDLLTQLHWLAADQDHNKHAIGVAIERMLNDAAKRHAEK